MFDKCLYDIPAQNGVIKVLLELKNRGAILNVLSASPHITLDACLKRLGSFIYLIMYGRAMILTQRKQILKFINWRPKE